MKVTGRVEIELEFTHLSSEWGGAGAGAGGFPGAGDSNAGLFPGESSSGFNSGFISELSEEFYSRAQGRLSCLGTRRSVAMKRSGGQRGIRHSFLRSQAQEQLLHLHHQNHPQASCWFREDSSSESEWEVDEEPDQPDEIRDFFMPGVKIEEQADDGWGFATPGSETQDGWGNPEPTGWNESLWDQPQAGNEDDDSWKEAWSSKPKQRMISSSEQRIPTAEERCEGIQWQASRAFAKLMDEVEYPESDPESEEDEDESDGDLDEGERAVKEWKQEGAAAREKSAYEHFLKALEEDSQLRRIYLLQKKSGPFWCLVCYAWGRRKMFPNLNSLIRHAKTLKKTRRKSEHRGYARAVSNYVLLAKPQPIRKVV